MGPTSACPVPSAGICKAANQSNEYASLPLQAKLWFEGAGRAIEICRSFTGSSDARPTIIGRLQTDWLGADNWRDQTFRCAYRVDRLC